MNILSVDAHALKVWFDEDNMWILLSDGRQLAIPLVYFPRLHNARHEQLNSYELSGSGTGIHWDEIDEDIYVPNLLLGIYDHTRNQGMAV